MTEPVDVVVSEWMGYALFSDYMLLSVVDARDRFMKPGGLVLPNMATVHMALLSDQPRYDGSVTFWEDVYGFDFSSLIPQAKRSWSSYQRRESVDPALIVSQPAEVIRIDCASVTPQELLDPMEAEVRLVADKDCTVHGFTLWFDVDFYGKASLSTSPTATQTHWNQTVVMFETPHELKAGDALVGTLLLEPGRTPERGRTLERRPGFAVVNYDVVPAARAAVGAGDRKYSSKFFLDGSTNRS
jgi:protein arginine N-methyltransferase 1